MVFSVSTRVYMVYFLLRFVGHIVGSPEKLSVKSAVALNTGRVQNHFRLHSVCKLHFPAFGTLHPAFPGCWFWYTLLLLWDFLSTAKTSFYVSCALWKVIYLFASFYCPFLRAHFCKICKYLTCCKIDKNLQKVKRTWLKESQMDYLKC